MAHPAQNEFINLAKKYFPKFFQNQKVLEVGSLDINGSIRTFFDDCDYTGVDLELAKGVDIATPGQFIDFPSQSFDLTISCECFEHNPFWLETFINMLRMTKPNSLVILTIACYGRPEHGTTNSTPGASPLTVKKGMEWNYYRNLSGLDLMKKVDLTNWFSNFRFYYNFLSKDVYFIGIVKSDQESSQQLLDGDRQKLDAIQEFYRKNWRNRLYENMCFLGKDIFENLKLAWLLRPKHHISDKLHRIFN